MDRGERQRDGAAADGRDRRDARARDLDVRAQSAAVMASGARRTIAVVTTSRADYGHLYWPLKELQARPNVDLRIVAIGAHLASEFGTTVNEIERDGFTV